uniref:Cingulin b n=1 Tax=Seriola dumerili TaxID=41447 RepID=A0A3B4V1R6_SERDU
MSSLSTDRKPLVDYGVQIRFIKDLHDTGGGHPDKSRANNSATPPSNKYGVAVRVQGISGQPYVVLKDGEKGDSYGVQLNTPTPSSGSTSPCNSLPKTNKEPAEFANPYILAANTGHSPVSPAEDEDGEIFGSPLKPKAEPQLKATGSEAEKNKDSTDTEEYNEAGLKPVKLNGVGPRGVKQAGSGLTGSLGRYSGKKQRKDSPSESFPELPASTDEEPAPAIDTNSLAPINKLISKFNSSTPGSAPQTRGRSGARQRLRFDERRRSRSLDARGEVQPEVSLPSSTSPILMNPYAVPPSTSSNLLMSSAPASGSLGRSPASVAKERMAREGAESRLRTVLTHCTADVMTLQADLAEAAMLRHRQEDTLHQRERELTALKGVLKEEVECHDREMEALREQYSQDMAQLRKTMEQVTQVDGTDSYILCISQSHRTSLCCSSEVRTETPGIISLSFSFIFSAHTHTHTHKIALAHSSCSHTHYSSLITYPKELQRCHDDLKRARADLDKQKGELDEKSKALQALKKAGGEKEAELQSEISRLKEQSQKDKAELEKALEKAKEVKQPTNPMFISGHFIVLQTRLHSSMNRSSEAEEAVEALEDENRSLKSQLEEAKRGATRLSKERDELTRRLEERDLERDALRRGKSDLEEQKRLLDRALEKINKEMEMMMGDSRQSVASLQTQLDDYRERSRKDLLEAQRNSKDRLAELQRAQSNLKAQQDEVRKRCYKKKEETRRRGKVNLDLLSNRLKHLESELETEKSTHTDRTREIRGLEDKIKTLEIELDEERSSVELLNDRITRSRDQVDQLRSELMQERSARHDLEMDKSALERQLKELRSRVADMEGQTRPSAGINLLENKIQELEERLHSEEREKAGIQASQRRMERKLKELNATLDQERSQHVEQRDQLSLRVKALKRQVDESEGEVERLEGVRRKVLRDLEEQQELQEALQAKVTALEQTHRAALGSSTLSSEDEDGFYDTNITSILNESHLQTTSS